MDSRFLAHNSHLDNPKAFGKLDPHLRLLSKQSLIHSPALLTSLPAGKSGIYSIAGGRQIGKTTLLKQWMQILLKSKTPAENIAFFTGELIDDHHTLVRLLTEHLQEHETLQYILLDEVSYIKGWDKGIKFLADSGILENTVLVLTGSDTTFIQEARMRFPGRRGKEDVVDFHLYPLTFREVVELKKALNKKELSLLELKPETASIKLLQKLFAQFNQYLVHGGFLTAINDMASDKSILTSTLATYSDWIRGDMLKRGKQETYLREVLAAMIKRLGSQVTWNNLAQDLSIDHAKTVADYISLLASMDVAIVQGALMEDKLTVAPKKPRKLHFSDPFIFHAIRHWISPVKNPFEEQIQLSLGDPVWTSKLAESVAVSQVNKSYPTYYIKAEGEVDIAYVEGKNFLPVEIKWTSQMRPNDLKQVKKYDKGQIWTKQTSFNPIHDITTIPLPVALLNFGRSD